jgi:hypothetical protein
MVLADMLNFKNGMKFASILRTIKIAFLTRFGSVCFTGLWETKLNIKSKKYGQQEIDGCKLYTTQVPLTR